MKRQTLLFFVAFLMVGLVSQGQIYEMYHQGFEQGEAQTYSISSGTAAPQTALASGGSRALKMQHGDANVTLVLDTIDFTNYSTLNNFTLEFMHICDVAPSTCASASLVAVIRVKRPGVTAWTTMSQTYYNRAEGGSDDFNYTSSFSNVSYPDWSTGTPSNTWWKHERFDLDNYFRGVAIADRKLEVQMTLMMRTASGTSNAGWYIDDIIVKASPQPIIKPIIKMVAYPDMTNYPNSRGARVTLDVTTTATQGMCADSIYLEYSVGHNPALTRLYMTPVAGSTSRYTAYIPFFGFDTLMRFHVIARDATTNHNTATFPYNESAWCEYRCVRGVSNSSDLSQTLSNSAVFPFSTFGDTRAEVVYDSATLAAAGYKPGAITDLTFMINTASALQRRDRFQIRMRNMPSVHTTSSNGVFYEDFMKIVYDSVLVIEPISVATPLNIHLQDTFFYAGQDILVQMFCDNVTNDPAATNIKHFATAPNKQSVHVGASASIGTDPFTSPEFKMGTLATSRPHIVFNSKVNQPLIYDCGIAALAYPNENHSAQASANDSVSVWLKNYGVSTINAVRIAYKLDNNAPVNYSWSGTLAAGDSVRVRLTSAQAFSVGHHTISAWVGDTITVASGIRLDYEPHNDTASSSFIACAGTMSGVVQVGGTGADFDRLEDLLFSMQQCGVGGPLTVKLAAGQYSPITMPTINGISATNYVKFEPLSGSVAFVADDNSNVLVNMTNVAHVRFSNITFRRPANAGSMNYLVLLGTTSNDCRFENCVFEDLASTPVTSLLFADGADQVIVDSCTFIGGTVGADIYGTASDIRSTGNQVKHSEFHGQNTNAVRIVNQTSVVVEGNYMEDVASNSSYVLMAQHCYGSTQIVANKIFASHGAGCLGVADIFGTASTPVIIANNMVVCNDDGLSNMLTTPINIISVSNTKVVYNSVKLNAPNRTSVAAATFGGGLISNSAFQNNIVTCFDSNNYAFSYIPGSGTGNVVGHNLYYSQGSILNKYSGTSAPTLARWQNLVPSDNASVCENPDFLNGSLIDLRTFSQYVKGLATPIAQVTTDIEGNARDASQPCAGAFEFVALFYDFSISALESPLSEYCAAPSDIPLNVVVRNAGVGTFVPDASGTVQLVYSCGSQTGTVTVTDTIPANGTAVVHTGRFLSLPPNGQTDATYNVRVWTVSTLDPNAVNDTNEFSVVSRYHSGAPTPVNTTVNYGNTANINITGGLDSWKVDIYNSGRTRKSTVYWYDSPLSVDPIYIGNNYTSDPLYEDTTFYIAQKRSMPLMKITEVQLNRSGVGVTSPYPAWFGSATKFAVELSNVGDYPCNLLGDTLLVVSATNSFNNKRYVFPNITVQPGQSIVMQYRSGNTTDSSATLYFGSNVEPGATVNFAVVYRDGLGVADAVAFNSVTGSNNTWWTSAGVPSYIWAGDGIAISASNAGVRRTGWPSYPSQSPANTAQYWSLSTNSDRMNLGEVDAQQMIFIDNGCEGDKVPLTITVNPNSRPPIDLAVDAPVTNEGCGLGDEPVSVVVHNHGIQAANQVVLHYAVDATVYTDTLAASLASASSVTHTFSHLLNMRALSDTIYNVRVWVDAYSGDGDHVNDTNSASFESLYTPAMLTIASPRTRDYGSRDTIRVLSPVRSGDYFRWYDRNMNVIGTADTFATPALYESDTFYARQIARTLHDVHIGTLASLTSATANNQPAPYNMVRQYAREQYLYTASELAAAGLQAGPIGAISFYFDSLYGSNNSVTFQDYEIGIGHTTNASYNNGNWLPVQRVYYSNNVTVRKNGRGWITHVLDSTFVWDGTSNIVVQVTRNSGGATGNATSRYTSASNRAVYRNDNTDIRTSNTAGTRGAVRPDILFGYPVPDGCEGPLTSVIYHINNAPEYEAVLMWPNGIDTTEFSSCGNTELDVVVANRGVNDITNYTLSYSVDGGALTPISSLPTILAAQQSTIRILSAPLNPGRHTVKAVVSVPGDTIPDNDTVTYILNVRFCGGTYTIGTASDYATFAEAIDTLHQVGVAGAVTFNVVSGTYNEQLQIPSYHGASTTNTVTFQSATGNADDVVLRYAPVQNNNYVLLLTDSVSNVTFRDMTIYAAGTGNFSNAVSINNASNIVFDRTTVRVKGTINHQNASCVEVTDNVSNLTFRNAVIDSGYYSVTASITNGTLTDFTFDSCEITNFWSGGLRFSGVNGIRVRDNHIQSGVTINARPLTALYIENSMQAFEIHRNNIVLNDTKSGAKTGISIKDCRATNADRSVIYNNMVALYSTVACNNSVGILVDGNSQYINAYYNSVKLEFGTPTANTTTTALKSTTNVTNFFVLNNIFANYNRGYAIYMQTMTTVTTSNFNDYYSSAPNRLAYCGGEIMTLDSLRQVTSDNANSVNIQPYFQSVTDLHLLVGNLATRAQYNPDVPMDIDGNIRSQIPAPTIGAHEYSRLVHDMAVVEILNPTMLTTCIESDPVMIHAKFYNNGTATESNITWYAELVGVPGVSSTTRTIRSIAAGNNYLDSVLLTPPLGIVDTQYVRVVVMMNNDVDTSNNSLEQGFVLSPAFNITASSITVPSGCDLRNAVVQIAIKNDGMKPISGSAPIEVGFYAYLNTPASVSIPTLPLTIRDNITLGSDLPVGVTRTVSFVTPANLYPTGVDTNITLRARGWVHYQYDLKPQRDTTSYTTVNSWYVPQPPIGEDLHIPYATWDTLWASQINCRPIRWYRDSTGDPFLTSNNYRLSRHWDNAPQYFHDSTYYLNCLSDKGCASHFSPIHVILNPRVNVDVAAIAVEQPFSPRVYQENDTVAIRIINYGSQPATNIPIVYEIYKTTTRGALIEPPIQTAREICHATLNQDEEYVYKFDSLFHVPVELYNTFNQYAVRAWTELPGEMIPLNDTLRRPYLFQTLDENGYNIAAGLNVTSKEGMDIVRVSFNTLDWDMPDVGHDYLNLGTYNNPEAGVLHVQRGMIDTLRFMCANNKNSDDYRTEVGLQVYIDFNRNGHYEVFESVVEGLVTDRTLQNYVIEIPQNAAFGYMKMRIVLNENTEEVVNPHEGEIPAGMVLDYLLYVDEDIPTVDAALTTITNLRKNIVDSSDHNIGFVLANKGAQPLTSATIVAQFEQVDEGTRVFDTVYWTGNIAPGHSTYIGLHPHNFVEGTTNLMITAEVDQDTLTDNNTLHYQYHRFPVLLLSFDDNFDDSTTIWYAPTGYNDYSRNYWERGAPAKTNISVPFSSPNVFATSLNEVVQTGKLGNKSYLYTPIFDISNITPDTIRFRLAKDMPEGSFMYVEFLSFEGHWVKLDLPGTDTWYDSEDGFTGNTSGGYDMLMMRTTAVSGDFAELLQFRFVYQAKEGASITTTYGDGCAVDNFALIRGQRDLDAGVIAITHPTEPKYGQTIYPTVRIKNYGYDTLRSFEVAYRPYGTHLERVETYVGVIPPNGTGDYTFAHPFVITNIYPDTFMMCAFTDISGDFYHDNDTTCGEFHLAPLDHDVEMLEFMSPLYHVVAGDSMVVTTKLRNFGQEPVPNVAVTCVFNMTDTVTEYLDFMNLLGRPLESVEEFNYTFHRKFQATMGTMFFSAYSTYSEDEYPYNDTISTRISGIAAVNDLRAAGIVVDTSSFSEVKIQLMIDNVGARGANDFEVGFWIDNDTSTLHVERFTREFPLAALTSTCFVFDSTLPIRSAPYNHVCAYVHIAGDNDPSNDTTTTLVEQYVDIVVRKVLVEENRNDVCRVRLEVENIGNLTLSRTYQITTTINGNRLSPEQCSVPLMPGRIHHLDFDATVPKSATRTYEGTGKLTVSGDRNQGNNQTSVVEVQNYFEGVPFVEGDDGIDLLQNYPNPYSEQTHIRFSIPTTSQVRFFVMDVTGRICYETTQRYDAGEHTITLDGSNYASGIYYYGINCDGVVRMRKMVIR